MKKVLSLLSAVIITAGIASSVSACQLSENPTHDETAILEFASWNNDGRNINLIFDKPNPNYSVSDFQVTYYDVNCNYKTIGVLGYSSSVLTTNADMPGDANFNKMFVTCLKNHSIVQIDGTDLDKNMVTEVSLDQESKNEANGFNAFDIGIKFLNNVPKLKANDFFIKVITNNEQKIYSNGKNYSFAYDASIKKCKITINDPKFCIEKATSAYIKYKNQDWKEMLEPNAAFLDIVNDTQKMKFNKDNQSKQELYDLTKHTPDHITDWNTFIRQYRYFYYDFNREAFNPEVSWYDYVDNSGKTTPGFLSSAVDLTKLKFSGKSGYSITMDMNTKDQMRCEMWVNTTIDISGHLFMMVHLSLMGNIEDYGNSYYQLHLHGDARFTNYKI